ncbi:protein of unknown function zinc metallopeptidase putative [Kribbella flavida DSM 17836]|uniref:Metalloprotease-like protein n=2 Tax=Kribbella flavida TaxID=182640 RepID=D2Q1E6_KRIFD|nr:protein of unknown function zinc metallopeptidase putative [Kribbella flavida DSM 17836]
MQQLPHGLGWGAPPPGGPQRPRKKSKAPWIVVPILLVGLAMAGLAIATAIAQQNRPNDYSSPVPTSTPSTPASTPVGTPTEEPTAGPSSTAPTTPVPTRPTVTRPTAPRTTSTPPVRRGPTDYEIVSRNRIYRAGTMPSLGCRESNARPSTAAGARANYANLKNCLGRSWPVLVQRSGAQFRPPTVLTFTGVVQSPCGSMSDTGPPFYCSSNEAIYMNLREDVGNYNRYRHSNGKVWARMWMLHQFAHEYGHHIQHLTGILEANHDMRYDAPTRAAELEMTRRLELQASCFSDVFIGANRRTYPITGQAQREWKWLIAHTIDPRRDHGNAENHRYWAQRGYDARTPAACNTFTSTSARVQ